MMPESARSIVVTGMVRTMQEHPTLFAQIMQEAGRDMDFTAEPFIGTCWNCEGTDLVILPDPDMKFATDMVVCLDCHEEQPDE
jgi:hypothetical protein